MKSLLTPSCPRDPSLSIPIAPQILSRAVDRSSVNSAASGCSDRYRARLRLGAPRRCSPTASGESQVSGERRARRRSGGSIQRHLIENTRLGIPAILHEEICSGFDGREAACSQALGVAATFDPAQPTARRLGACRCVRWALIRAFRVLDICRDRGEAASSPMAKTRSSCRRWAWASSPATGSDDGLDRARAWLPPQALRQLYCLEGGMN